VLHGRPPRLALQAVDQLHGLGKRVGDRSAGGRQIAPRPETSGVEHNLDPGLLCGAGVVRQVADQYGRSRVNLQPSEVVCQVFLLRVRWCRALDEREVRRQPVPLDGRDQLAVREQRQQRLRMSGAVPLAEKVRQPRRRRGLPLVEQVVRVEGPVEEVALLIRRITIKYRGVKNCGPETGGARGTSPS